MLTVQDLDGQIPSLCQTVPLGMSEFQIRQIVLNKGSSSRSYRQVIMELHKRYQALKKAEFRKRRFDAEVALKDAEIAKEKDEHKKAILQVDLEEKRYDGVMEDLLIRDAVIEVTTILEALEQLPALTRDEFEAGEQDHWTRHFLLEARREMIATGRIGLGTLEQLENCGVSPEQAHVEIGQLVERNRQKVIDEQAKLSAPK